MVMERKIIFWSKEDDNLLKELYPNADREIIVDRLGRTWKAIRIRAMKLGVQRSQDVVKKENFEYTKKAMLSKYGVEYSTQLPSMKEKSKQTNLRKRGVEYPTQSEKVREKVKKTVQEKYGVDNVFQAQEIKEKSEKTNIEKYGVKNPNQNPKIREKSEKTNIERYGVPNTFQLTDRVKKGMLDKYGVECPLLVPESIQKKKETCIKKYGFEYAIQNEQVKEKLKEVLNTKEVKEKKNNSLRKNGKLHFSNEELKFLEYLLIIDPNIKWHQIHPDTKDIIDFYSPQYDLWIQFDGIYWHGKYNVKYSEFQSKGINRVIAKDKEQNKLIPNLVRFWSDDISEAISNNTILNLINDKISEKIKNKNSNISCHQYKKKIEHYTEDLKSLPFNPDSIKASDFTLSKENITLEIRDFIKKYEWLGNVGVNPKWGFTARYKGILGGVVLINEPTAYSTILGKDTPIYEALIQRGATASWTPKNLGSRLVSFSCKWMVNNTSKRAFIGYSDPLANERGIIYQACNFDYLGDKFGAKYLYEHPKIDKLFSEHSLKRTSFFKKWCKENNIIIEKNWFNEKGFKDLNNIPEAIKEKWYSWIKNIISESKKIATNLKRKYVLVLPIDKKEQKTLNNLKTYKKFPYDKNYGTIKVLPIERPNINNHGKTADRKNTKKIEFIISNHHNMPRSEIASNLGETIRWVKRQIKYLIREGKIIAKR